MLRIDIITVIPELMHGFLNHSILKRAQQNGSADIHLISLREYGLGNNRQVDDYRYGGGAGMVMRIEPVYECIRQLQSQRNYDEIIYTAPDAEVFHQGTANHLSTLENLIILCGHYKGIDERIREHLITREISLGDFVLTGGELAAAVMTDAIVRLLPGVLGDEESALTDSFQDGLLAPPEFTRPPEFNGWKVPDVLLSGNFKHIEDWRFEQSLERTRQRRPELYQKFQNDLS